MLSFRKPASKQIDDFLRAQRQLAFTYPEVGATAGNPPAGYQIDRTRIRLGAGEATFRDACAALRRWEQFQLGWVEVSSPETPLVTGETVAVLGYAMGVWWTNACRIVCAIDEKGPVSRFGFVYGTLPGHVECGEERFLLEWEQDTGSVWYDIFAFSKPNLLVAKIGYPLVRARQKKFARDSATQMFRAIHRELPVPQIEQSSSDRSPS